jgi:hypothetical protein
MTAARLPRPVAWRIHPAEMARFAAEHKHCETLKCRQPITIVTWRWWRSASAGRVLIGGHFVCDTHGASFAQRHGIEIEPAAEREMRRLGEAEMAALTGKSRHCSSHACENPATCVFTVRYTGRGKPHTDEDLAWITMPDCSPPSSESASHRRRAPGDEETSHELDHDHR